MLYLLMDEKKDTTLIKIGKTSNLANREKAYHTTNPLVEKISYIKIKKDDIAEKEYHFEMILLGFERVEQTEWFKINSNIAEFIKYYGFNAFATTKNYHNVSYIYGTNCKNPIPKIKLKDFKAGVM